MESLRGLSSSPASAYDELVTGQKSIRYHWQGILSVIRALPGGLGERVESARRQLEESGATVNLLDDRGAPRWTFDPLPFVVTPDEWSEIESGVVQRARLLDAVLADVYGPQTLLQDQLLPPMLVHANRHFQRPCRVTDGKAPPRYLAHYAVDLVRLSNGRWHVLADHTEVPSGIGYAIEMRRVLARSLPEAFRSIPVRHLRPFVDHWHDSLLAMAPAGMAQPNMAVLTPGSLSTTYFEHVYLSRVLGVPLVEGGDLVARDGAVSIKTLAGLRPVHMLLRRLDSSFADPLELRADSALGVTGLVEATRTGAISLANALGSGVVETPAMMPFLERLSEKLLGQPLQLPSLDVWWLGEPAALTFALANLDLMIVRPCLEADREPIIVGMLEAGRAQGAGGAHPRPARPLRGAVSRDALAQPEMGRQQPGAGRHGDARVRERRGRLLSRAAGRPGARAGGRHLPALARPAERHAEGRLGAGRGRSRRAGPLDAALPPGRRRAQRCRPAKPRRRQSLLARPLHRAPGQRRPPAAHHGDQGGDRRGEPARRPRIAPAGTPAEPGQPDGPGLGPVGAGERRLPAGPRGGRPPTIAA